MAQAVGPIDCLADTSTLIKIWRGDEALKTAIARRNCGIETVASLEFLQGVNKRQKERADEFIEQFQFIPFTPAISYRAMDLIRAFSHLKGLRMADALIASTALELNVTLLTFNTKHFDFIKGIKLI